MPDHDGSPEAEVDPRRQFDPFVEVKAAFAQVGKIDLAKMRAESDEYIDPYPHDPWERRDRD